MEKNYEQIINLAIDNSFKIAMSQGFNLNEEIFNYVKRGKKVRSKSLLMWIAAYNPKLLEDDRVLNVTASIEIAHRSTLISDDLIDGQKERNGYPTIELTLGKSLAILSAPFLQALAIEICPPEFRRIINTAIQNTLEGQILQENQEFTTLKTSVSENANIIELKSGSIGNAALQIANNFTTQQTKKNPDKICLNMARAYQICNDLADIGGWLNNRTSVLPDDIQNRTLTFPILNAIQRVSIKDKKLLLDFIHGRNANTDIVCSILQKSDTYSQSMSFIKKYICAATNIFANILYKGNNRDQFIYHVESIWIKNYLKTGE